MQLPCLMQLIQEALHRERPQEEKENEIVGDTWPVSKEEKRDGRGMSRGNSGKGTTDRESMNIQPIRQSGGHESQTYLRTQFPAMTSFVNPLPLLS